MTNAATVLTRTILLSVAAFLLLAVPAETRSEPKAVSLDYCADQFLLSLADREQIMALSRDAVESHSFYRDRARGLPLFRATSEEVLHMSPDIVMRSWGGLDMLPLLARTDIPVISAGYGAGPEALYDNIRLFGAALLQRDRAQTMIRAHQQRWSALKAKTSAGGPELRAAYFAPGGITAGADTFVNDIIKMAGLASVAEEFGLTGWQTLPLENLIQNPPDIIIGSFFNQKNIHVSNWSLTRHNRIRQMIDNIPTIMVPGRYLSCNGIFSVDAAEYIQNELQKILSGKTRGDRP